MLSSGLMSFIVSSNTSKPFCYVNFILHRINLSVNSYAEIQLKNDGWKIANET